MQYQIISAILSGQWAISRDYANGVLPLVAKLLANEKVEFGLEKPKMETATQIFIGGASAATVVGVGVGTNLATVPDNAVVVYNLIGPVVKYGGACSYGAIDHAHEITRLANSQNVSAIVLHIDSPGGQVSGTQLLADAIKDATAKKPVVGMVNDGIAASAAMWIGSACTEMYCTKKSDSVGSIGVYFSLADFSGYYEKQGIKVRDIYADASTDKNGIIREALAGNDEPLKEELGYTAESFFQVIKENRGEKLTSDKWNTGKMFRAKEATKIGLIDGIKSFEQIIARAQQLTNASNKNTPMEKEQSNIQTTTEANTAPVAFTRIMQAANIQEIKITDEGFAMDEPALNALESTIADQASTIADQASTIATLNNRIAELEATDQASTIADQASTIATLNNRIAELERQPDGDFAQTTKEADSHGNANASGKKFLTSYDKIKQEQRAKFGHK